jgi:hypothetical protein
MARMSAQKLVTMAAAVLLGPALWLMMDLPHVAWRLAAGVLWGVCLGRVFIAIARAP